MRTHFKLGGVGGASPHYSFFMPHPYDNAFSHISAPFLGAAAYHLATNAGRYIGDALGVADFVVGASHAFAEGKEDQIIDDNPHFVPPGSKSIEQYMYRRGRFRRSFRRRFGGFRRGFRSARSFARRYYGLNRGYRGRY